MQVPSCDVTDATCTQAQIFSQIESSLDNEAYSVGTECRTCVLLFHAVFFKGFNISSYVRNTNKNTRIVRDIWGNLSPCVTPCSFAHEFDKFCNKNVLKSKHFKSHKGSTYSLQVIIMHINNLIYTKISCNSNTSQYKAFSINVFNLLGHHQQRDSAKLLYLTSRNCFTYQIYR